MIYLKALNTVMENKKGSVVVAFIVSGRKVESALHSLAHLPKLGCCDSVVLLPLFMRESAP